MGDAEMERNMCQKKLTGALVLNQESFDGQPVDRHSRESGNPGGITIGKCIFLLDASLRWHDEIEPLRINEMDQ